MDSFISEVFDLTMVSVSVYCFYAMAEERGKEIEEFFFEKLASLYPCLAELLMREINS
jgi:hypothetical protein